MRKLYVEEELTLGQSYKISGDDGRHLSRVLRAEVGDEIVICALGTEYDCVIEAIERDEVTVSVGEGRPAAGEPRVKVTLYVGLPKAEKLEHIIQKAVELGAEGIVPFAATRSVAKTSGREDNKSARRRKIAQEAAKQCGRGVVPSVSDVVTFDAAVAQGAKADLALLCYECGGEPLSAVLKAHSEVASVAILTGPEGGISPEEYEKASALGWKTVTLGSRILRCETAPLCALSAAMYEYGEF
ncbi:MAG: 16S rRNA (uracil(1498)-N(3))-methyltransferase [Clostridia bacterium]|nr:16S rRNA (uracil(1498)-N(3))-methyltransferase [Clostridia bacterium]